MLADCHSENISVARPLLLILASINYCRGIYVKKDFTILIADRNPHVRELLKRELTDEGYTIRLAKNALEVIEHVFRDESLSLLILDPDLPDAERSCLIDALKNRIPALPLVVHTFHNHDDEHTNSWPICVFVEKDGMSVERLKQTISRMMPKIK